MKSNYDNRRLQQLKIPIVSYSEREHHTRADSGKGGN